MWSDRAQNIHVGATPTTRADPCSERISKDTYRPVGNQRNHLGRACEGDAQGWNWSCLGDILAPGLSRWLMGTTCARPPRVLMVWE